MEKLRGYKAVGIVIKYMSDNLSLTGYKVFAYEKPKDYNDNYIVVNHVYFSDDDEPMQEGIININVHVKDNIKGGFPMSKHNEIVDRIADKFQDTMIEGAYYNTTSVSSPFKDADSTHFVNIRIQCLYTNKL